MRRLWQEAGCVFVTEEGAVEPQTLGRIASFYYLKYQTLSIFSAYLQPGMTIQDVSSLLSEAALHIWNV